MWIGSSTDIDDLMRTQAQLVSAQAQLANRAVQLEALVQERTSELNTANRQLLAEADERGAEQPGGAGGNAQALADGGGVH